MSNKYTLDVDVRVRDLDRNDHVNHAVYISYIEYVRNKYWWDVLGDNDISRVVANLEIEYRKPIELHDDVQVSIDLGELGNSSIVLDYEIRSNGEVAAIAESVQVRVDDRGKPQPLPDYFREAIQGYHLE